MQTLGYRPLKEPRWKTTGGRATPVVTWHRRATCRRQLQWSKASALLNIVPQNAQHNGGAWAKIEQDTRHYVRRAKGDVFVITGPVFAPDAPEIGAGRVKVPAYLYKLVYDTSTQRAWAHWQQNREGETVRRPISYGELVQRTGIEFLPGIPVKW